MKDVTDAQDEQLFNSAKKRKKGKTHRVSTVIGDRSQKTALEEQRRRWSD